MSEEGGNRVCHRGRSKCSGVVGETHAEDDPSVVHRELASDATGAEDPSRCSTRGCNKQQQYNAGDNKGSSICEKSAEQSEGCDGVSASGRLCSSANEGQRELTSEVVLMHEMPEEVATERRRVHFDGLDEQAWAELEVNTIEDVYNREWYSPTLAECNSLTRSFYEATNTPCAMLTSLAEAKANALIDSMTGKCRVITPEQDYYVNLKTNSEANVPEVYSEANVPEVYSEANVPEVYSEANVPEVYSEANVPEVNSEVIALETNSEVNGSESNPGVYSVYLLERFGEQEETDGDLEQIWLEVQKTSRLPQLTWIGGTCLQTHAKTRKGKTLSEPVTIASPPHRVSVLLCDDEDKLETSIDSWLCMGRKKRERVIKNNAHIIATVFFQSRANAVTFAEWIAATKIWSAQPWQEWMRAEETRALMCKTQSPLEGMEFGDLVKQMFQLLQKRNMPAQHRALEAVKEGMFSTVNLGASTQRGPKISKALRSGAWSRELILIHELARRRPESLQRPYLAAAINQGGASAHTDANDGSTTILGFGSYRGGLLKVGDQRPMHLKGVWLEFDASIEHQTTTFEGERFTLSLYTPRHAGRLLTKEHLDELQRYGFPVKWFLEEHDWRQQVEHVEDEAWQLVEDATWQFPEVEDDGQGPTEVENLGGGADELRATNDWTDEVVMETPTEAQKKSILRAHCNLGHCAVPQLVRAMKLAGVRPGIRLWTKKEFRCNECESRGRIVKRPATLSKSFQFNQVVGVDTIHVTVGDQTMQLWLNIVDFGTRYQQAAPMTSETENPTSEAALEAFEASWMSVFGLPETILTDLGSEFKGAFAQKFEAEGVQHLTINSRAPWEQGITERTGGLLKEQIKIAAEVSEPTSASEVRQLVRYAVLARNQHTDRSGFAPAQRVYGQLPTFPLDLVDDSYIDADVLALGTRQEMKRSSDIRASARGAFFKLAERTRYQRAQRASTVPQPEFKTGDMCFVLRRNALSRQWREGPGIVVQVLGATAWVAIRGELLKCSKLALLKATSEDQKGVEAVKEHMPDLLAELKRHRQVRDVTNEDQRLPRTPAVPEGQRLPGTPAVLEGQRLPGTPAVIEGQRLPGTPAMPEGQRLPRTPARRRAGTQGEASSVQDTEDSAIGRTTRRRLDPQIAARVAELEGNDQEERQAHVAERESSAAIPAVRGSEQTVPEERSDVQEPKQPEGSEYGPERSARQATVSARSQAYISKKAKAAEDGPHPSGYPMKNGVDEVDVTKLTDEQFHAFDEAKMKEVSSVIHENKALRPLSVKESREMLEKFPERVVRSRFHYRMKPKDSEKGIDYVHKVRWVLLGFEDPDVHDMPNSSPTPALQ
eukprot:6491327-Amphidinium_carterae.1